VRRIGRVLVGLWLVTALLAPWIAPYPAERQFRDATYASPTRLQLTRGDDGVPRLSFHPVTLIDPLRRTYEDDRSRHVAIRWFTRGHLFQPAADDAPLFLVGADGLGRDVFSRTIISARVSIGLGMLAVMGSLAIGALAGLLSGYAGGRLDRLLMRGADLVTILPVLYVLLALRAALPLDLPHRVTLVLIATLFALVGWPFTARGVRAIIAAERGRAYVLAAEALGASPLRITLRHLLPATVGFLETQGALLLPMFVIAEATLGYAGLGLPDNLPGWGTLLQEAGNIGVLGTAPWLLVPAVALFSLVLGVNLAFERAAGLVLESTRSHYARTTAET
jgi:peptide/nickel transport system permease protein